jgi:hypothetical protein
VYVRRRTEGLVVSTSFYGLHDFSTRATLKSGRGGFLITVPMVTETTGSLVTELPVARNTPVASAGLTLASNLPFWAHKRLR